MPTIQQVIDAPALSIGDKYDVMQAMNEVRKIAGRLDSYYPISPGILCVERKIDVSYDGERGAITEVILYNAVPFAVITRAGRGCEDWVNTYVVDSEYAAKAVELTEEPIILDSIEVGAEIELAYWEGTHVSLGDVGWKAVEQ